MNQETGSSKVPSEWKIIAAQTFGITASGAREAAFLCVRVGCSWRSGIALLWVLQCETLICEYWVESDLDVHWGLGEPTVQPEPLETDVVVDRRPPALRQVPFWIRPVRGVKENWVMDAVTGVQRT